MARAFGAVSGNTPCLAEVRFRELTQVPARVCANEMLKRLALATCSLEMEILPYTVGPELLFPLAALIDHLANQEPACPEHLRLGYCSPQTRLTTQAI